MTKYNIKSQKSKQNMNPPIKICTYNANLKLNTTHNIAHLQQFLTQNNISVALLQEVGLHQPTFPKNCDYEYIHQTTSLPHKHPPNHTTSIIIHKSLVPLISTTTTHKTGRFTTLTLTMTKDETLRLTSIYLPTNTQFLPHYHNTIRDTYSILDEVVSLPPTTHHIVAGDFNECDVRERHCKNPERYNPCRFAPYLCNLNLKDIVIHSNFLREPTYYYTSTSNKTTFHGSARLDKILASSSVLPKYPPSTHIHKLDSPLTIWLYPAPLVYHQSN